MYMYVYMTNALIYIYIYVQLSFSLPPYHNINVFSRLTYNGNISLDLDPTAPFFRKNAACSWVASPKAPVVACENRWGIS